MSKAIENLKAAFQRAMAIRPKVGGFPYLAETFASRSLVYPRGSGLLVGHNRQIPPTRCRAAGPTLHPLASEPHCERGVLSVSALCISVHLGKGDKCKSCVEP
jgi:hypothetical protein